ncbi:MAG: D-arabinono-1,4-lactone oxidase, partial [Bacteroidia bacterium]|nr:FAD-binding protein [Bacteroidia bacterium]MDW8334619.1 D-arabinono-1,4-lactone oxidase [Bacteroidia bacterium]
MNTVVNWGGTLNFKPAHLEFPQSEEQVSEIVRKARSEGKTVRVVGAGHSWTPLIRTDDCLISLDRMQGLISTGGMSAEVCAGTRLRRLGKLLFDQGLAMENLGDIDKQSLAGAMSTGTHGTGMSFGVIATQATQITFIDGTGEKRTLDQADPEFKSTAVSLGAMGVITSVRLRLLPAYNLECVKKKEKLDDTLAKIDEYRFNNRNFEFFWFPYSDYCCPKIFNVTAAAPVERPMRKFLVDVVYENGLFKIFSEINRAFPSLSPYISRLASAGLSTVREVHHGHRIYSSPRLVRFIEMEYGVPASEGPAVMQKIRRFISQQRIRVHFPIEYRYVRGDDLSLSPAYGRDTVFISCHMYKGMEYNRYFKGLEPIFLAHGGRPHWGKIHHLNAADLRPMYPKWDEFLSVREKYDPDGVFLN